MFDAISMGLESTMSVLRTKVTAVVIALLAAPAATPVHAASGAETGRSGSRPEACSIAVNKAGAKGQVIGGCDCEKDGGGYWTCVASWSGSGGGPRITITQARYGSGSTFGNVTAAVGALCDGKPRCVVPVTNSTLGQDPTPMKQKIIEISFDCGAYPGGFRTGSEGSSVQLSC